MCIRDSLTPGGLLGLAAVGEAGQHRAPGHHGGDQHDLHREELAGQAAGASRAGPCAGPRAGPYAGSYEALYEASYAGSQAAPYAGSSHGRQCASWLVRERNARKGDRRHNAVHSLRDPTSQSRGPATTRR